MFEREAREPLFYPLLTHSTHSCHLRNSDHSVSFTLEHRYVVVTWHPLQVFLYRDGLALFASEIYDPDENVDDEDVLATRRTMHLTNSAVNMNVRVCVCSIVPHSLQLKHDTTGTQRRR